MLMVAQAECGWQLGRVSACFVHWFRRNEAPNQFTPNQIK